MEHTLKTLAPYWDAVQTGHKNFEVRRDDRGFQRGDVLILRRMMAHSPHSYDLTPGATPEFRELRRRIGYILSGGQFGIEPGYVVMGLEDA